ncbi:MAG: HD domain-containing protein [Rickettsiales bacterium]|jgi:putative hydrolase of HD superfamily|nr:HD domain-containing protein [Rickettsiales bacterium]
MSLTTNKAQSVIQFYVLCNKLKNSIRAGWRLWNVKRDRLESIAEHIFGVQQLAIAMWSQYNYTIDIRKVVMMLALHELEETIIGDLTIWDIAPDEKLAQGHDAVSRALDGILRRDEIVALILEFDAKETAEAKFAYWCDKLEADIQCKLYDRDGAVNTDDQATNPAAQDKRVQELLAEKGCWSSMWLAFGRRGNGYDEHFTEVSEYVENNNIAE